MPIADARRFYRSLRGSLRAAAAVLTLDVVLSGSILMASVFCPIWVLVSILRSAFVRPGWGIALARVFIPALTLFLVKANDAFQLSVAEAHSQRILAACEQFHADKGRFPRKLDELVPNYMNSVPVAKYCLGPGSRFFYSAGSGNHAMLAWQIVAPYYRKIYNFDSRRWSYLD